MQARVMKLMPVMFTVLFLFFPSGLVLYWLTNNVLSHRPAMVDYAANRKRRRAARPSWATPSRRSLPPQDMVASALSGYRDRTP